MAAQSNNAHANTRASSDTLELDGIVKRYKGDTVLDNINLSVPTASTLVLFGPSGGGKSVLLRLIAGVIEPDKGQILINGRDMADVDPEDRGIGMAFQNFALFPHMSAHNNIASSLEMTEPSKSRLKAAVESVAKLLKIDHVLDHTPRELSNGQKQRTALARALVGSPSLLLLDDPLRNVDAKLRFEMRIELPALLAQQQTTVVYVTQDYKEAMALGDQIVVLAAGRIIQTGTPAEIYQQPATIDIARQFGDPAINLLSVTPQQDDNGLFVTVSGTRLPLDSGYGDISGKPCVLGLRAESLTFAEPGKTDNTGPTIPVTIEAVTPLNEKTVTLAMTSGNRELLLSRPAGTDGPVAGEALVCIDASTIHLFDEATGLRISHNQSPQIPHSGGTAAAA
jgi:multiple sugar transport system ATP-binding protein